MRKISVLVAILLATTALATPSISHAQVGASLNLSFNLFAPPPVAIAPPPLPVYIVPAPPAVDLVWAPGYWAWTESGYCWVPGTWVAPPVVGVVWTPGYWGWNEGSFVFHEGYWGPHVGFYGGISYGGGYDGVGFRGGSWNGGHYVVNRSVTNVTNITNVTNVTRASFNGGPGGIHAAPTPQQQATANEKHVEPTSEQRSHITSASQNPQLLASANHGKPTIAATAKPGDFSHGVIAAKAAGPRNTAAEQHNASVMKNPDMAKGAALPKSQTTQPRNAQEPARATNAPTETPKPPQANEQQNRPAAIEPHAEPNVARPIPIERPAENPAAQRPIGEHQVNEPPAGEKPIEPRSATPPTAQPRPAIERPATERPAVEKQPEEKPVEKKPEEEKPAGDEHHPE